MKIIDVYAPYLGFGDFSDVFVEESHSLTIRWEDGKVQTVSRSEDSGVGIRFLKDGETRYAHTQVPQPFNGSLEASIRERFEKLSSNLTYGLKKASPPHFKSPILKTHAISDHPQKHSLQEKMDLLKKAFDEVMKDSLIRQVSVNYGEKVKKVGYLNSEGDVFTEDRVYLVFNVLVTAKDGSDMQTAYESLGGLTGFELFKNDKVVEAAEIVRKRVHNKLKAPQAPVGEMPVIIASASGGTLIHEAVGHSLEADAVIEGTSPAFAGKMDQKVGNEKLTVLDDPTLPNARGSFHFDDEGTPSQRTVLIENGILKDYLWDRKSALKMKRPSNGHGRRESYAHRPIPRMSNTFVVPGKDDPAQILDSVSDGLLVMRMGGGQVNTANGDFVFDVEEGYRIQKGKKELVRGATLLGNGPRVLQNIDMIGTDHGWAIGTCGKEGQGVPVSDALPTVRIQKLVVGGQ